MKMEKIQSSSRLILIFVLTIGFSQLSHQFYLPGLAPVNYCKESEKTKSCKVRNERKVTARRKNIRFFEKVAICLFLFVHAVTMV